MMPQRAYVLLPTHTVSTFRGIRKYSTELASANELGGTMQMSPLNSTNDLGSKCFGSSTAESALVNFFTSHAALHPVPHAARFGHHRRDNDDRGVAFSGTPAPHRSEGAALRERDAAARQRARAVFGQVLSGGRAVHSLRH